jgi:hypothetical protein
MAKKISAKAVLKDIHAGMHQTALMAKYELSPRQLQSLFKKLIDAGLLEPPEHPEPDHAGSSRTDTIAICPGCQTPLSELDDECPKCGLVISKLAEPAGGLGATTGKAAAEVPSALSFTYQPMQTFFYSNIIAGIVLVLGLVGGYFFYQSYEHFKAYHRVMLDLRPLLTSLSQRKVVEWSATSERLNQGLVTWKPVLAKAHPELYQAVKTLAGNADTLVQLEDELQSVIAQATEEAKTRVEQPFGESLEADPEGDIAENETETRSPAVDSRQNAGKRIHEIRTRMDNLRRSAGSLATLILRDLV